MNSDEFLKELQYKLRGLPEDEKINAVRFFEEYIHKANLSPGTDVTTICGTPEEAARQVMSGSIDSRSVKKSVRAHETRSQREGRHNGILGVFVVLGILITGAVAAFSALGLAIDFSHFKIFKSSNKVTGTIALDDFTSIDASTDTAKVELISDGDSYFVDYSLTNDEIKTTIDNGKLTLEYKSPTLFSFGSSGDNHITIHIPKGTALDDVKLTADTGSVTFTDITCSTAWLEADTGSVNLNSSKAAEATLTTDTGGINVNNSNVEKNLNVDADTGSIKLSDSELSDIIVASDTGSFTVTNTSFNTVQAELDTGSINIEAPGKQEDYDLELETDTGSVKLNGNKEEKNVSQKGGSGKSITAETDTGSLIIDFTE